MTLFSRITLFFVSSMALMWSSSVFAGTLSNISISSTSYEPGATATYTISFTAETTVPASIFSAIQITANVVSGNSLNFSGVWTGDVTLTVNGSNQTVDSVVTLNNIIHSYFVGSIPAGAEVVLVINDVVNPGIAGSYGFFEFATYHLASLVDGGSPSPIIIANPDITAPTLSQESDSIAEYTNDTTPTFTFTSNEAGTISYSGSCSSVTTLATIGENIISFAELDEDTYTDCAITVTDAEDNESTALEIPDFTIDTTDPILTVIQDIPERTRGGIDFTFTISEACNFISEAPASTLGDVETQIGTTGEENTYFARVGGAQRGGTYSFSFLCRDQANNVSNLLTVGPFTVTGGDEGGSIIMPPSADPQTNIGIMPPSIAQKEIDITPTPAEPEVTETPEIPTVIPQKEKYVFLVDITPRRKNSEKDVRALQTFFNQYEGESLSVNGVYDTETIAAVNRFQRKYASEILAPWGIDYATGNVGIYTRKKIAAIMGV